MNEKVPIKTLQQCFDQNEHFNFGIKDMKPRTEGKKFNRKPHRHDFYFLLFIHKGSGYHTTDFKSYKITDYSVFSSHPDKFTLCNWTRTPKVLPFSSNQSFTC